MKAILAAAAATFVAFAASAQAPGELRFMRVSMAGDPVAQYAYKNAEMCKAVVDSTKQQAEATPLPHGVTVSCSATDVSSILPFETAVRDDYFGYEMLVATKTDVMCQNMTASISKQLVIGTNRPQYSTLVPCKLRG